MHYQTESFKIIHKWQKSVMSIENSKALNQLVRLIKMNIPTVAGIKEDFLCQAGMDFQQPTLFPMSIYANGTYGLHLHGITRQPVDSLLSTLWKYAQQPYPERINQSWAAALVLMVLVLSINILARLWVQARSRAIQGK